MRNKCVFGRVIATIALVVAAPLASAQDFPTKPIRMVAPEAGSGAATLARLVADGISPGLRQPVVVDHRGGNIIVPVELVTSAPADGYTLLFFSSAVWMAPYLQDVRFDPVRDLSPISLAFNTPSVLAVHQSVAANSVAEFIALAKRRPGEINYAAGGFGSANHLAGELFKSMAGINLAYVPYKGSAQALTGLLGGDVSAIFATSSSLIPLAKSGKVRVLGVTSAQATELMPGAPAIASTVPGYQASVPLAVFAPAKTPAARIERLSAEIVRYVRAPQARQAFMNAGAEPVGNSPQELAAYIKTEMDVMSKVIKDANIKVNN